MNLEELILKLRQLQIDKPELAKWLVYMDSQGSELVLVEKYLKNNIYGYVPITNLFVKIMEQLTK